MDSHTLIRLSVSDGADILDMLREVGPGENGFINDGWALTDAEYKNYLRRHNAASRGFALTKRHTPQTIYWFYAGERPVGIGKLRPRLTADLLRVGGNIAYCIRPSERGRGYGGMLLEGLLSEAARLGLNEVLITSMDINKASRRMIERQGGELENIENGTCRYWIRGLLTRFF